MKYLPGQSEKQMRVKIEQVILLRAALTHYARQHSLSAPPKARLARVLRMALPKQLPYVISLYPHEWEIVSQALRPEGSNPQPGSEFARWYALYTAMRKVFIFKTEGEEARLRAAARARRL